MAKQTIDLGTFGGADGSGDSIRTAGVKINDNFSEVYEFAPVKSDIRFQGNNIVTLSSNANIDISAAGTGSVNLKDFKINDNNIETTNTNGDLRIVPSGTGYVMIDGLGFSGTSIHAPDSSSVNINENLIVAGTLNAGAPTFDAAVTVESTLDVTSATTLSTLTVSGASSFVGPSTVDNLTFNDNIISTSSNADLILTPGGTGVVNVSNITVDSSINLTDNVIKVTRSDDDFVLSANGTGSVQVSKIDMNSGTVDNTVIGGTTPAAGTFTTLVFDPVASGSLSSSGVTITDNKITANQSNDNLELAANGSGYVSINGIQFPHADGSSGQLLRTDGSGLLSWVTSPILLGQSDIQDARNTIGFSSISELDANTATGAHENIGAGTDSVLDSFDQAKYDSAWYLMLQRYDAADSSVEYAGFKTTIAQGTADGSTFDAFDGTSQIIKTNNNDEIIATSSDIRSTVGKVRFKGQAGTLADGSTKSTFNAVTFYRIGLGDNDSSGYTDGNIATKVTADLDSATATVDSWAHASFRGAKYYVSVNNTTTQEVMNAEFIVVHNGTDAFIHTYNQFSTNSSNTPLATFTADISGSDVRVRGANGTAGTCRVTMYRIILADNESDTTINPIERIIGAQTVSNTASTTIDTNSFRGSASPDMSSQKVINSWAKTDFDSVFYHMVQKDMTNNEFVMNKLSVNHGISSDGSTEAAGVAESHIIKSGEMNDISAFDVNISGSNVELKATGQSDGSTAIQNSLQYYAIGLGPNTTTATSGNIGTHAGVIAGGNNETTIDHVTASGTTQGIVAAERTVAEFTAGQYDSAWYFVVSNDVVNGSLETQKISLMHNLTDAFVTSSAVVSTDPGDTHPTFDADIVSAGDSTSKVRLRSTDSDGSTVTPSNTLAYYRIGLGDDDSTGYAGAETDETTIARVTLDSSVANIDTFASGANSGAKYFISVNNLSTGEVSNIEAIVTHDNSDAFIVSYNEHFSGNNSLIELSADLNGGNVRLRGSATAGGSTRVTAYRILLADSESEQIGTNTRTTTTVTDVTSAFTTIDTFNSDSVDAAHYIVVGRTGSNGGSVTEATVVTDGTNAFVSQHGEVSMKTQHDTAHITLQASHDGSNTVTLQASATNAAGGGQNTAVTVYRIDLKAPVNNTVTLDSWASSSYRGAKYYISADDTINGHVTNIECLVVHDGTDSYISTFGEHSSHGSLMTVTTDVSGGNVRLLVTPTSADVKLKFYRIRLADNESGSTGTDFNTVAATTVSSSATAIDTFVDTQFTGAHYVIIARNASEGSSEIQEATVLTNGAEAFVSHANHVSSKSTPMLTLSAAHDGSSTVTLSAASSAGGSTTVNAFRIHMKVEDAFAYDVIDGFGYTGVQLANYIAVGKNAANESQIAELMVVSDATAPYIVSDVANISTHSATSPLMNFTVAHNGSNVELRAENTQQNTDTTVNLYRIALTRLAGAPSSIATLDTFDKTVYRSAKYTVSVSDTETGALGHYETADVNVTHDGTNVYFSEFGRVGNSTSNLVTFSTDISGNDVRLRGTISNTNTHTVTVVRRVMKV